MKSCGAVILIILFAGCKYVGTPPIKQLPICGPPEIKRSIINNKEVIDTVCHTVADFALTNQYGDSVHTAMMDGKVYVANTFNTICSSEGLEKLEQELKKVQQAYIDTQDFYILSFTVDTKWDTPAQLLAYIKRKGIIDKHRFLLTGQSIDSMHHLIRSYLLQVGVNPDNPRCGFIHDNIVTLIDRHGRIRGFYDLMDSKYTERLIRDIHTLLNTN